MYEDSDNKRKAEFRNPSMLADASFGSVQKNKIITEPSPDHRNKSLTLSSKNNLTDIYVRRRRQQKKSGNPQHFNTCGRFI